MKYIWVKVFKEVERKINWVWTIGQLSLKWCLWNITYSKGCCETSFHPSVHSSGHPFVPSWSIYFDGVEKEWNTNTTW